jgi:hypothetical protein
VNSATAAVKIRVAHQALKSGVLSMGECIGILPINFKLRHHRVGRQNSSGWQSSGECRAKSRYGQIYILNNL